MSSGNFQKTFLNNLTIFITLKENEIIAHQSRLRVEKVLAPYYARPKVVPLIKIAKLMWFSKY